MLSGDFRFLSFLQGGVESSTHRRLDGLRLDIVHATRHDEFALSDYRLLSHFGLRTVRESARWHLIEQTKGIYDFRSLTPVLDAAAQTDSEVILDLLHFGWPDHVDCLSEQFPHEFARFARAVAKYLGSRPEPLKYVAAINEISFLSWAGGAAGCLNPCRMDCAQQFKRNLVRAAVLASEVLLSELPGVRLIAPEPVIHIVANSTREDDLRRTQNHLRAQYEAWDMLSGRLDPELGGKAEYLDILGVNFYDRNQWVHDGARLNPGDPQYRPFRDMLQEVWTRYQRPLFVSETGAEDDRRADWFNYVCEEVYQAIAAGVPVKGICLYPILNHPGWDDDRHCHNGLFDYPDAAGSREVCQPLAEAILAQRQRFTPTDLPSYDITSFGHTMPVSPSMGLRFSTAATFDEPLCKNP